MTCPPTNSLSGLCNCLIQCSGLSSIELVATYCFIVGSSFVHATDRLWPGLSSPVWAPPTISLSINPPPRRVLSIFNQMQAISPHSCPFNHKRIYINRAVIAQPATMAGHHHSNWRISPTHRHSSHRFILLLLCRSTATAVSTYRHIARIQVYCRQSIDRLTLFPPAALS